jgi:hypothetical protein
VPAHEEKYVESLEPKSSRFGGMKIGILGGIHPKKNRGFIWFHEVYPSHDF